MAPKQRRFHTSYSLPKSHLHTKLHMWYANTARFLAWTMILANIYIHLWERSINYTNFFIHFGENACITMYPLLPATLNIFTNRHKLVGSLYLCSSHFKSFRTRVRYRLSSICVKMQHIEAIYNIPRSYTYARILYHRDSSPCVW